MAIIKNPLTIVQTGGESQVPEYMSAKNFTFDGNACTGYVGDNSFPEIIIPKSYSKISSIETVVGAKVLNKSEIRYIIRVFQSATFSDGENNTHTYLSPMELDMLADDFPNDCYLVSMEVRDRFNFDFLRDAYDMQILQFPININGQSFDDGMTAFDYIRQNDITNVNFGGDAEVISYIDGDDYQVTSIASNNNNSGFANYHNKVILLNNITSIGIRAFYNCRNLSGISMPSTITNIGNYAFLNCWNLKMITIPPNVNSIGSSSFLYCSNLTSAIVPEGVTSIAVNTFLGAGLMTIILPSTVTSIGAGAFENCLYLQSIIVNNNNNTYHSKDNCIIKTNTKELVVGCNTSIIPDDDTVTSIANRAFKGSGISSINIPNNIISIGNSAFSGCNSLTTMTILATTPPTLENTNAISSATTRIYIPAGTLSAYQSATNWSNFASLFEELPA